MLDEIIFCILLQQKKPQIAVQSSRFFADKVAATKDSKPKARMFLKKLPPGIKARKLADLFTEKSIASLALLLPNPKKEDELVEQTDNHPSPAEETALVGETPETEKEVAKVLQVQDQKPRPVTKMDRKFIKLKAFRLLESPIQETFQAAYKAKLFATPYKYLTWNDPDDQVIQYKLGSFCEYGKQGAPKDFQQALVWYRKAALQGDPNALFRMACFHDRFPDDSKGEQENLTLSSREIYEKAAAQGHPKAIKKIAKLNAKMGRELELKAKRKAKNLSKTPRNVINGGSRSGLNSKKVVVGGKVSKAGRNAAAAVVAVQGSKTGQRVPLKAKPVAK